MRKKDLIGKKAYYLNPKNPSNIKDIRKIEAVGRDKEMILIYLENGVVANSQIIYLADNNQDINSLIDKNF